MRFSKIKFFVLFLILASFIGFLHARNGGPIPAPAQTAAVADASSSFPAFALITEPDAGLAPVEKAIETAKKSLDLVMYELSDKEIEKELVDAKARGVSVRVILNAEGPFGAKPNEAAYQYLASSGIPVIRSSDEFTFTHQKTLVVDGNEAVIMTFNFTPQYYASSRDFGIIDRDQKDVAAIEKTFAADWKGSSGGGNSGDDLVWSPGSADALLALIAGASTSVEIYNEEMADPRIIAALEAAAKRGADVRIVMTYATDWKSAFNDLLGAGADIRTFASTAKTYIHAKMILVDGVAAFLGSENFSATSLDKNRELGLLLDEPDIIASLSSTFETDWTAARPYTYR